MGAPRNHFYGGWGPLKKLCPGAHIPLRPKRSKAKDYSVFTFIFPIKFFY